MQWTSFKHEITDSGLKVWQELVCELQLLNILNLLSREIVNCTWYPVHTTHIIPQGTCWLIRRQQRHWKSPHNIVMICIYVTQYIAGYRTQSSNSRPISFLLGIFSVFINYNELQRTDRSCQSALIKKIYGLYIHNYMYICILVFI